MSSDCRIAARARWRRPPSSYTRARRPPPRRSPCSAASGWPATRSRRASFSGRPANFPSRRPARCRSRGCGKSSSVYARRDLPRVGRGRDPHGGGRRDAGAAARPGADRRAGGVGLTAVEIGKALGARVIAAASTAEKLAVARERGADETVDYATEKLTERVLALTDGKGVDVCFDPVGGELFDAALSSLGWGGRILLVGFVGGVPQIPANRLLVKHRAALGSSLRYFRWHAPDKLRRSVEELLGWYGEGKLRPCITHRVPLERSVEAIRLLTDRKAHGKVVVVPDGR